MGKDNDEMGEAALTGLALALGPVGWAGAGVYWTGKWFAKGAPDRAAKRLYKRAAEANRAREAKAAKDAAEALRISNLAAEKWRRDAAERQRQQEEYLRLNPPPTRDHVLAKAKQEYEDDMRLAMMVQDNVLRDAYAENAQEKYRRVVMDIMR